MRTILISMLRTWANVLTNPSEQTFDAERSKSSATVSAALAWILLASVLAALLSILRTTFIDIWVIPGHEMDWYEPHNFIRKILIFSRDLRLEISLLYSEMARLYGSLWLHSGLFDLIGRSVINVVSHFLYDIFVGIPHWQRHIVVSLLSPVFFLVKVVIFHYISTLLGGRGLFGRYVYLVAAYDAPITILESLLDFLPLVGGGIVAVLPGSSLMVGQNWYYALSNVGYVVLAIIPAVYWLALTYFATRAEHGLTEGRAIVGIFVSSLLGVVISTSPLAGFMGLVHAAGIPVEWHLPAHDRSLAGYMGLLHAAGLMRQ